MVQQEVYMEQNQNNPKIAQKVVNHDEYAYFLKINTFI